MTKQSKAKKTGPARGRPKGSTTRPSTEVEQDLPRCRDCRATDFTILRTTTKPIVGQLPDGTRYTSVVWRRAKCNACGAVTVLRSYPFAPDVWKGGDGPAVGRDPFAS